MKSMVQLPLKATSEVDFAKSLKNYVRSAGADSEDSLQALQTMNKMRNVALVNVPDRHENGLNTLMRYYDQFCSMERRFPINQEVRINFSWCDAFNRKGVFGSSKKSLCSGGFEKACVLFNVAAFSTQIAGAVRGTDDASMQTAMKHYTTAAGIYEYLRDHVGSLLGGQPATTDMSAECLGFLAALCHAQAQECVWTKALASKSTSI